ncbi:MAG: hypothetical protein ACI974_000082, partial [Paraglaciecola sp.]
RKEFFNEIQHQKASQITPIFNVDRPLGPIINLINPLQRNLLP